LLLDRQGRLGWCHSTPYMAVAFRTDELAAARVALHRGEV
jgi:hypothetical protein